MIQVATTYQFGKKCKTTSGRYISKAKSFILKTVGLTEKCYKTKVFPRLFSLKSRLIQTVKTYQLEEICKLPMHGTFAGPTRLSSKLLI